MAFFIDKKGKRKSPFALAIFFAVLAFCLIYFVAFAFLTEPLHRLFGIQNPLTETVVLDLIISGIGTAACCLLFFLPDKRIVPYAFAAYPIVMVFFAVAALGMNVVKQSVILSLILLYALVPAVFGNTVSWVLYRKCFRMAGAEKRDLYNNGLWRSVK